MAKKLKVRNKTKLIEDKREVYAAIDGQYRELADRVTTLQGQVAKLDLEAAGGAKAAVEMLTRNTSEIASAQMVLAGLGARRSKLYQELQELRGAVDLDAVDELRPKEREAEAVAFTLLQQLHEALGQLRPIREAILRAGARPMDRLPVRLDHDVDVAIGRMRKDYPELFGLPQKLSPRQKRVRDLRAQLQHVRRVQADIRRLPGDDARLVLQSDEEARRAAEERLVRELETLGEHAGKPVADEAREAAEVTKNAVRAAYIQAVESLRTAKKRKAAK